VSVLVLPVEDDVDAGADAPITDPLQLEDPAPAGTGC
jgi:hypothetical protein